jgi:sulfite exporter TauE/SafE/copper chaperone CopZ
MPSQKKYRVQGMHCKSCEILIERKIIKFPGVKDVNAYNDKGTVEIDYEGQCPNLSTINDALREHGYKITELNANPGSTVEDDAPAPSQWRIWSVAILVIIGFIILYRSGLSSTLTVNNTSALPAFFVFGLLAGLSSCAALVGGIVLSMSKQWIGLYAANATTNQKLQPHWMFNIGRIVSYSVLGGLLGLLGSALKPSVGLTTVLTIIVALFMMALGLQMMGVRSMQKFQLRLPKFITRKIADETRFQGRYMPFIMGALTFFLPCGFTVTAQTLALLSGSMWRGGLIMLFFVLGTLPVLMGIGLSSVKLTRYRSNSGLFLRVAGVLVLFFALFNINSQFNLLGWPSVGDLLPKKSTASSDINSSATNNTNLPPIVNGKQIVKMNANAYGYKPNQLTVQAGVPVRWEITDTGTNGCAGAIIARSFFSDVVQLTPGTTTTKEFTPTKVGTYKFSCTMGMYTGVIKVVDATN